MAEKVSHLFWHDSWVLVHFGVCLETSLDVDRKPGDVSAYRQLNDTTQDFESLPAWHVQHVRNNRKPPSLVTPLESKDKLQ